MHLPLLTEPAVVSSTGVPSDQVKFQDAPLPEQTLVGGGQVATVCPPTSPERLTGELMAVTANETLVVACEVIGTDPVDGVISVVEGRSPWPVDGISVA